MLRRMLRRRMTGRDSGVALVAVIGLSAVMLLVIGTALTGASSGLRLANASQSSARALDAAYAGVQDYIAKLNADSTYTQYGNPGAAFSSAGSVTLPATTNAAFGLGTGGTWAAVPGSSSAATFRYEVDNSLYGSGGLLRLRSTGSYGGATKTIVASIQQQGFINYLYFTNYETQDPQITGTSADCALYLWANTTRSSSSCPTIQFGPNDVLGGPVRSNDTMTVCGARFNGPVTSSNPRSPIVATPSGCAAAATYASAPTYAPVLSMPATNTSMKAQTYTDTAKTPGCLYTGPTQITLKTDGTMTVVSPWTKFTQVTSDGTSGTDPDVCGTLSALHSTTGATVAVPANNLVYVQSVPTSMTDVNSTPTSATTTSTSSVNCNPGYSSGQCTLADGTTSCSSTDYSANMCIFTTTTTTGITKGAVPSSVTQSAWNSGTSYTCTGSDGSALATSTSSGSAGWIFTDPSGTLRFPLASESPASNWKNGSAWDTTTSAYGCRNGDAFVSGTLSGQLTIASDNYVYATGDVLYKDPRSDVLGLVGNNGVLVWNPMSWGTPMIAAQNREIDAAILSPAHTFQVQNYNVGSYRGVLTVDGSIAQNYRGPVATTSGGSTVTGYSKNYTYDARFVTVTPPYYLKPTSASFRVSSYASTPSPAFLSTGAAN
jgi:hypothetical protein